MTWLIVQVIAWCLVGFGVGALAAWLVAVMLFPHEREVLAPVRPGDSEGGLDA